MQVEAIPNFLVIGVVLCDGAGCDGSVGGHQRDPENMALVVEPHGGTLLPLLS
jgi:hypothetical protein